MGQPVITIRGARQHNLKNLNLELPKGQLIVVTGPSGSGKSSLAYHTLYAEGQRRYLESLSARARQYLTKLDKPDVDSIDGLSPALALDQHGGQGNPRSLVATVTELYDYLRLLYAAIGLPHDPATGALLKRMSSGEIASALAAAPESTRLILLAPLPDALSDNLPSAIRELQRQGFLRFRIDGSLTEAEDLLAAPPATFTAAEVVIDRLIVRPGFDSRLADSIETALRLSPDELRVLIQPPSDEDYHLQSFFTRFRNPETGYILADLSPRHFSFNSPWGACPVCHGLGQIRRYAEEKLVPDPSLSVSQGAVKTWLPSSRKAELLQLNQSLYKLLSESSLSPDTPWRELPAEARQELTNHLCEQAALIPESDLTPSLRQKLAKLGTLQTCPACAGGRLRPESLAITLPHQNGEEKNPAQLLALTIADALQWLGGVLIPDILADACADLKNQILHRLRFLDELGLGYLALDRPASTLSGGELQRVRLATQLGGGLSGVLYVLDEPTIGLHPRDGERLIRALRNLTADGNTVLVVEHDEDLIRAADTVLDMGPEAGKRGGEILALDTPDKLAAHPRSLTGKWLSGQEKMPSFPRRQITPDTPRLTIRTPREHNLRGQNVSLPLGAFLCLTGPSGSGKSTLVNNILFPALSRHLHRSGAKPGAHDGIDGLEHLKRVVMIDQSPLGRSPRSNPATATGLFDLLRPLFAKLPLSRQRGYTAARFSFNRAGGRCDKCEGTGLLELDMNFLSDVYVTCDACRGLRYNRETLEIAWRGKNIAEILSLTIEEAVEFFRELPQILAPLKTLNDLGLGYMQLDQPAHTLSGGEAQRIKLAAELGNPSPLPTLYLLDEPTTGLHFSDISRLLTALFRLRKKGHTILCIEHQLDVIRASDWIIDLGPGGGEQGGNIVAEGTPETIARTENSPTGKWLRKS